ncbi:MAG: NAD(P)/FAD-dependent oxidoreductase [Acidimicrobiales bacterium]
MALNAPIMPITATDDELRAALQQAHLPSLLPALALITGDRSLLRDDLRPDTTAIFDPNAGLSQPQLAECLELAYGALRRYRDGGCRVAPEPTGEELLDVMAFLVDDRVLMAGYQAFFTTELGLGGADAQTPPWTKAAVAPDRPYRVAIIGAGMSGLAAAHRLTQVGVDHVVLEKNHDVGGTWLENTYPGCRVDVPSHLYQYSFAQRDDWPHVFSKQDALLDYFRSVADDLGVGRSIRFDTEVHSATFDEARAVWVLDIVGPDGAERLEADAIISAAGQLNRPHLPEIAGRELFAGFSFHSARWDPTVDLRGKRVAVIGTGATAAQLVPEVARDAGELLVFQRTPSWIGPSPDYHDETPKGLRWLLRHVPTYSHWYRLWLFWRTAEGLLPAARVDPDWSDTRSVSAVNEGLRQLLAAHIESQIDDDPRLVAQVMPQYPPAAKRIVRDCGTWLEALQRPNVTVVTDAIDTITATGIRAAGADHDVDVIIYATGFTASQFLTPMRVVGRNGVELHDRWDGDARAYLGITVPGFPSLFLLYGPNTNIVLNGSIIFFSECAVHYVLGCLRLLLDGGHGALDCRPEVHDAYNVGIDEGNLAMAWGAATVNTWYRNAKGRISQNWPFSLLEYWLQTRAPDPADYELLEPGASPTNSTQ